MGEKTSNDIYSESTQVIHTHTKNACMFLGRVSSKVL